MGTVAEEYGKGTRWGRDKKEGTAWVDYQPARTAYQAADGIAQGLYVTERKVRLVDEVVIEPVGWRRRNYRATVA